MENTDERYVQDDLTFLELIERAIALPNAMTGLDCEKELKKVLDRAEFWASRPVNEFGYVMTDD
jgi:hypothetical protein